VVGIRERVPRAQLKEAIPRGIAEVHDYFQELGVTPTGPPMTIYPAPDDDGMFEIAVAWPVAEPVLERGPIHSWTLPSVRALRLRLTGPYERLSNGYRLLEETMADNGLEPAGDPREAYVTDPAEVTDPDEYVTEILWPIGPEGELDTSRDVFTRRVEPPEGALR
jgi:effector-binding domain-containing protein